MSVSYERPARRAAVILVGVAALALCACAVCPTGRGGAKAAPGNETAGMKWISFPDPRLDLRGLPWYAENAPDLWRLPKSAQGNIPKGAWARSLAPDGGRIRFSSNTTRLAVHAQAVNPGGRIKLDAYVDGKLVASADATSTQTEPVVFFRDAGHSSKDITIYLPNKNQGRFLGVGVDAKASVGPPAPYALPRPMVCYGSSVLQGSGVAHGGMTYPAIVARKLNLDFVNLGFGGSGKAEPSVVALVNQLDACCFLFDLGKSYGSQPLEVYGRMLDTIRASHPDTPIIVVTPIYSKKEPLDPAYRKRSEDLRALMRKAAEDRIKAGDKNMHVVDGLYLCGPQDADYFHDPSHPNEAGNQRLADRLAPIVGKILFGKDSAEVR